MRNGDYLEISGLIFERHTVSGYVSSPLGPCLCYLDPVERRVQVSAYVPMDDRDLYVCRAVETYTGMDNISLVPCVGVARADGSPA